MAETSKAEGRRQKAELLLRLSSLLTYPQGVFSASALDSPSLVEFFLETAHVSPDGMQELYTTTFDLNPVATLEVGWHLWGEQYERGRFLADLRELQDRLGLDVGTELPDHLTVLLPTIAAMDECDELREQCAAAIDKILVKLDEQGNPYRHVLRAAREATGGRAPRPQSPGDTPGDDAIRAATLEPPAHDRGIGARRADPAAEAAALLGGSR